LEPKTLKELISLRFAALSVEERFLRHICSSVSLMLYHECVKQILYENKDMLKLLHHAIF